MDLINLLLTLIFSIHIFSCFWHGIALFQINELNQEDTWLHKFDFIQDSSVLRRYVTCFYFSLVTTTSVGYGDISASNYIERSYLIVMLIVSGILYAYTINSIGGIMESIKAPQKRMIEEQDIISEYMKDNKVSKDLKNKILNFLVYMHKMDNPTKRQSQLSVIS
jgi:hypothetical protein